MAMVWNGFEYRKNNAMIIQVSPGEVMDKAAILSIKSRRIKDPEKLVHVRKELGYLRNALKNEKIDNNCKEARALKKINSKLWDFENAIREKEERKHFDEEFVQIARTIYRLNNARYALKRIINLKYNSDFIEEKEYRTF